jgi:hypothetical protein
MSASHARNQALDELRTGMDKPGFHRGMPASSTSRDEDGPKKDSQWGRVTLIRENDVLLGRGSRSNQPGNVKFRQMIKENRFRYLAASKVDKPKIAEGVVKSWRRLTPPGRFLSRKDEEEGNTEKKDDDAVWCDVGDRKARLKTSMALRERTPEAVNYLQMIRKQEVAETQRSAMFVKQHLEMTGAPPGRHHQVYGDSGDHQGYNAYGEQPQVRAQPPHHSDRRYSVGGYPVQRPTAARESGRPMHLHTLHHSNSAPIPPRRSSLAMGDRAHHLYMMQQQVQAQQMRLEMEMKQAEIDGVDIRRPVRGGTRSLGSLPVIHDHSDNRDSEHTAEEEFLREVPIKRPRREAQKIPRSVTRAPSRPIHQEEKQEKDFYGDDSSPVRSQDFDNVDDIIVVDKFRSVLQGWTEPSPEDNSDLDDDILESFSPQRRRGVDRTRSNCSMQSACTVNSALSDLMAMSIITTNDDSFISLDKSGHSIKCFE